MLMKLPIEKILFLDIETVPEVAEWNALPENMKNLWAKKVERQLAEEESPEEHYSKRAGILSEFGKIICISVGIVTQNKIRLKSYYGDDEQKILSGFSDLLNDSYFSSGVILCAHNGKEFDFPYIARRMLIQGMKLPQALNIQAKSLGKFLIWIPWNCGNSGISNIILRSICWPQFLTFLLPKTTLTVRRSPKFIMKTMIWNELKNTVKRMY